VFLRSDVVFQNAVAFFKLTWFKNAAITTNRLLKIFFILIQKCVTYVFILSFLTRFVSLMCFLPLIVLPLFFFPSLHCRCAIGKHCLPLFFFTIDFCMFSISLMFCLMSLLTSLFHWEGFCLFSIVSSSSLFPCNIVYLRFIGKFLFAFSGLSMGWNSKNVKRYDMNAPRDQNKC